MTASVASGYFVAWWPGESAATKITGYNADGTVITEIGNNGWDFAQEPVPSSDPRSR